MLTWFFLVVTFYAFVGQFIFALTTRTSVAPEHRISRTLTAVIALVAGISYYLIQDYYRSMLEELAKLPTDELRLVMIRRSYNAIGQLRYMDWAITTPLLLLKTVFMLKIQAREARSALTALLLADFFMIVTGYVGEQQLSPTDEIRAVPKLVWGAISTIGYVIIPVVLFRLGRKFRERATADEWWAFRLMALSTVTTWGVYPIGYILTIIESFDLNYIHIAFSVADIVNKVGVGAISYLAAKKVLEARLPENATAPYHDVS